MQISIKYVNFPRPGGKYGTLKTEAGETIMVPPNLLGLFRAGQVVEIGTKDQTWGQGTEQERLVTIATTGPLNVNTEPVQGQGVQSGYQRPVQGQPLQRPNTGFQPRVIPGGAGPYGNAVTGPPPDQARQIFVTGVVGRAMGSGKFAASEILVLTQAANEAFERLKNPPKPAPEPAGEPPLDLLGDPGPELQ